MSWFISCLTSLLYLHVVDLLVACLCSLSSGNEHQLISWLTSLLYLLTSLLLVVGWVDSGPGSVCLWVWGGGGIMSSSRKLCPNFSIGDHLETVIEWSCNELAWVLSVHVVCTHGESWLKNFDVKRSPPMMSFHDTKTESRHEGWVYTVRPLPWIWHIWTCEVELLSILTLVVSWNLLFQLHHT